MYIPAHFNIDELAAKHGLIEAHPFGTLIVTLDGRSEATHLPVLLDRSDGPLGTLRAHMARANPSWRAFDGKAETLVMFLSVEGYISPDWYESEHQVPTWNYVAVHAYGVAKVLDDEGTVRLLDRLSARHENELAPKRPWTSDKLDPDYFAKLRGAIIAFEISITRLEGKTKLSQNKTAADVAGAAAALESRGGEKGQALA
ncbi:MAG: FMN-binding negative transcriptional regulator, partial [Alphaproteobacteria bacterium]|nr:FMN-binding negative transcriptional regulator [Alphaproteobacteria bacterium]